MIKALKKIVPTYVKYLYRAIPDYYYDLKRFYKYASNQGVKNSEEKYIGHIVKRYHVIEKGLTMPSPRLGFGKDIVLDLISLCNRYIDIYGITNIQLRNAIAVLLAYIEFHKEKSYAIAKDIVMAIIELSQRVKEGDDVLVQQQIHITREDYFNDIEKSLKLSDLLKELLNTKSNNCIKEVLPLLLAPANIAKFPCSKLIVPSLNLLYPLTFILSILMNIPLFPYYFHYIIKRFHNYI